jgi:O-antigen/teichoic acid export membrane protein
LLGAYLGVEEVGIYSVALATAAFVPVLLKSVNAIFGPVISELHGKGELGMVARLYQTSTKWCGALTWPLVCVLLVYAEDLMRIFGEDFSRGGPALAALAMGQLVNVAVGPAGQLLIMTGHQRAEVWIQFAAAVLSIVTLLLLVPRLGILGAAVAFSLVLALANLLRLFFVFSILSLSPYNRRYLKLLVPVVSSAVSIYVLQAATEGVMYPFWMRPLLAVTVAYAVLIILSLGMSLDADDRLIWRAVLRKARLAKSGHSV